MKGCSGTGCSARLAFVNALSVTLALATAAPRSPTEGVAVQSHQQFAPHVDVRQQHTHQQQVLPGSLRILRSQRTLPQDLSHEASRQEQQAGQEADLQAASPAGRGPSGAVGAAVSATSVHSLVLRTSLVHPVHTSRNTPAVISDDSSTKGGWQQWGCERARRLRWLVRPANGRILQPVTDDARGAAPGGGGHQARAFNNISSMASAGASDAVKQPTVVLGDPYTRPEPADPSIDTAGSLAAQATHTAAGPAASDERMHAAGSRGGPAVGAVMRQLPQNAWQAQQQQFQAAKTRSEPHSSAESMNGSNNSISDLGLDRRPGSTGSNNASNPPLPDFPVIQPGSSGGNEDSPLMTLLQGISLSWQQRQQLGACPGTTGHMDSSNEKCRQLLMAAWQDTMQQLQKQQPQLSGFAQLAGSHHLLLHMVANAGLPAIVLVPSNTALEAMLKAQQLAAAASSSDTTDWAVNSSWQQFVQSEQEAPAESILLLLRHIIPVWQPQLLDASGAVSHRLLEQTTAGEGTYQQQQQSPSQQHWAPGSSGNVGRTDLRVFNSLVLQTALGSYIQVSALPNVPSAYRLEQAASAAVANTSGSAVSDLTSRPWPVSPHNTGPDPLTQQQLLANRNRVNPNDTSAAATLSHLQIGAHLRASTQPFQISKSHIIAVGLNGVLGEGDEVVNGGTVARLRGAFGWSPYDEQALLSRVYLDPKSTYWAKTPQVLDSLQGSKGPEMTHPGSTAPGLAETAPQPPLTAADHESSADTRASSQSGGGGRRLAQYHATTSNSSSRNSSASVGSDGTIRTPAIFAVTPPTPNVGTFPGSSLPRNSSSGDQATVATVNTGSSTPHHTLSAAATAEMIARQQKRLVEFHMTDALAANLMTIEALSAWTAAAVTQPAAVFATLQQQASGRKEVNASVHNDINNDDGLAGHQCLVDWGSPCGMPWGCIRTGSSSSSNCTTCCYLSPAAANSDDAAAPYYLNDLSSNSNICPLNAAAAAGLGGAVSTGRCSGWEFHESSGRIDTALLVGLSPYQLYPSLGQYDAAYDERNHHTTAAIKASADIGGASATMEAAAANVSAAEITGGSQRPPWDAAPNTTSTTTLSAAAVSAAHLRTNSSNTDMTTGKSSNSAVNHTTSRGLKQADDSWAPAAAPPPWQPLSHILAARQQQPDTPAPAAAAVAGPATPEGAETGNADPPVPTGSWEGKKKVLMPHRPLAGLASEARVSQSSLPTKTAAPPATSASPLQALPTPVATPVAVEATAAATNKTAAPATATAPAPLLRVPVSPPPAEPISYNSSTSNTAMQHANSDGENSSSIDNNTSAVSNGSSISSSKDNSSAGYRDDSSDTGTVSAVQYDPPSSPRPSAASPHPPDATNSRNNSSNAPLQAVPSVSAALLAEGPAGTPAATAAAADAAAHNSVNSPPEAGSASVLVRIPTDQLSYLSVLELAGLLAEGQVDPQQLVELYSSRLRRYDSLLHATVTFTDALAVQQAAAAVQILHQHNITVQQPPAPAAALDLSSVAISRGLKQIDNTTIVNNYSTDGAEHAASGAAGGGDGPGVMQPGSQTSQASTQAKGRESLLSGIPYGLKDLFAVPGYPTSWGMSALRNRIINTPSWSFSALSGAAGGVLLAKTATGELAWGDVWFDGVTTRNPWNVNTGSCGSSAGSAVAVAAGLLPYAVGSETWGSIVCPATTVGVTAFRPTGGSIPGHGMLQISASLDKTGVFCRQALDCAVVADALMDHGDTVELNSSQGPPGGNTAAHSTRLHRQDPQQASAFNYTAYQNLLRSQQQQQSPWREDGHSLFPPTFQDLPPLATLCIGYLEGTSQNLIDALQALNAACVKGPLPAPGSSDMVLDALGVILQVDVSVSLEGLWQEGYINQDNHWYPLIQLGQVSPAAAYVKAQRLRALLLSQTKAYFRAYGIHVLLKASNSNIGTDGLATLLDMPELLLPVGFTVAAQKGLSSTQQDNILQQHQHTQGQQQEPQQQPPELLSGYPSAEQVWLQPDVNSIIAPPGHDAAVIAIGAAFQSVTAHHLVHPILPAI